METFKDDASILTRDQVKEIRELFEFFDNDQTGFISIANMQRVLACLGERIQDDAVAYFMAKFSDRNELNLEDFMRVFALTETAFSTPQELREIFALLDHDSDGMLEIPRLIHCMKTLEPDLPEHEIIRMIINAFPEYHTSHREFINQGKISYEQFVDFISCA